MIQTVTVRLHDCVPQDLIARWKAELQADEDAELRDRIAKYEDQGHGECLLRDERVAELVQDALLYFDGVRYFVLAWCVMPNHVHAMMQTVDGFPLDAIVHSWKSFTAHEANRLLGRSGPFWFQEYFDRYIRDAKHFQAAIAYIEGNPVKAGLVHGAAEWRFSSAWERGRVARES